MTELILFIAGAVVLVLTMAAVARIFNREFEIPEEDTRNADR